MSGLPLLLLTITATIISCVLFTVDAITCDPHCRPMCGCRKTGAGHCDGNSDSCCVQPQYRLRQSDHKCVLRCGGDCVKCPSYMKCEGCAIGYKLYAVGSMTLCRQGGCDPNCASDCYYYHTCYGPCAKGYKLAGSGLNKYCVSKGTLVGPCDSNCFYQVGGCQERDVGHCDAVCNGGYFLDKQSYYCAACDPYCIKPAYPAQSATCYVESSCNYGCMPGYWKDSSTSQCTQCSDGCTACTSETLCASCDIAYKLDTGVCAACDIYCVSGCITPGFCDGPLPHKCKLGYGMSDVVDMCGACDGNCDISATSGCEVTRAGKCDGTCKTGYIKTPTNQCAECQSPDPGNCRSCTTAGTCEVCTNLSKSPVSGYCDA